MEELSGLSDFFNSGFFCTNGKITAPFIFHTQIEYHIKEQNTEKMKEKSHNPATKKIARERIEVLFEQARQEFCAHPERSNRYVDIARKIAMRQRIRIDRELRRKYCHHCHSFLVPGRNMRVRVHRGNVVVTCHSCNKKTRYRLVKIHVEST
jgi:ribonuclease P protein subunit RPR2